MSKPDILRDLKESGHLSVGDVETIARTIFNEHTTMAGPAGYIITACNYDDLPPHVREFIRKAILQFKVKNVLDVEGAYPDEVAEEPEKTTDGLV